MRVVMNKMYLTPTFYRLGLVVILLSFLMAGCAETRYDDTTRKYSMGKEENAKAYTTSPEGAATTKYTSGQNYDATAKYTAKKDEEGKTYSSKESGVTYTIGQYDDSTDRYTLRQGGQSGQGGSSQSKTGYQSGTNQYGNKKASTAPDSHRSDVPMLIEIADILFDFDKWVIKESFYAELNEWAEFFLSNPTVTAEIYGHADSTGPTVYNQKLSEKRAQAVINYLAEKGVDPSRLTGKGLGETQPVAPNTTKQGRQKNRRVEVGL